MSDSHQDPERPLVSQQHTETRSRWQMTHPSGSLAAPVQQVELASERTKLQAQTEYGKNGQASSTLVKHEDLRIVLICLKAGHRIEKHRASGPISIQPIDGRIRLELPNRMVEVTVGHLLVLEPGVVHDVEAVGDTSFLLTVGRTTYPISKSDDAGR